MILLLSMLGCDALFGSHEEKRAELPQMIRSIKKAQIANYELLGFYVDADAYPKEPSSSSQPWVIADSGGFTAFAWNPGVESVYGSYSVKASADDFVITAVSDIDGDGVQATYTASKDTEPTLQTAAGMY